MASAAGTATVQSDLEGQRIRVDGSETGLTTPAVIRNLAPGPHVFEVEGPCRRGRTEVVIEDGKEVPVHVQTKLTAGTLEVRPTPAEAEVRLDGQPIGRNNLPTTVACGEHALSISMPGYLPALLRIRVDGGQTMVLPIELERLGTGRLRIGVAPDGARVLLDGVEVGQGSLDLESIPAGPHVVEVRAEGFVSREEQLLVEEGEESNLQVELQALPSAPLRRESGWWTPTHVAGTAAAVSGLGLGVLAVIELDRMTGMGREYHDRVETVNTVRDYEQYPPAHADRYRTEELLPQRNKAVALTAVSSLLLASGITLTVAF